MAEYGLLLRMPFFPILVKYAAETGKEGGTRAHLEAGTVPQQVPRAPALSMVTLNSGDSAPASFYGKLLGSAAGQGPRGFEQGPLLHYRARVRFRLKS